MGIFSIFHFNIAIQKHEENQFCDLQVGVWKSAEYCVSKEMFFHLKEK